jgi:hypothetical protein
MAGPFQVNALISPSDAGRSGAADTGSLRQNIQKMRLSKPESSAAGAWHSLGSMNGVQTPSQGPIRPQPNGSIGCLLNIQLAR